MSSTRRRGSGRAGFTLVEVLVAMLAGVLVLGGIYQLMTQSQKVYKFQAEQAAMQQAVRMAMDTIVRDLRQAGDDPNKIIFTSTNKAIDNGDFATQPADNSGSSYEPWPGQVHVRMDLPRDCGGKAGDNDGTVCPSTACGGDCRDGDTYDILDKSGNGKIDLGPAAGMRGESEIGNGFTDDVNPDEDIVYQYKKATVGDPLKPADAMNPYTYSGMIYRGVMTPKSQTDRVWEPFADNIDNENFGGTSIPLFQYLPDTKLPKRIIVTIRGHTRDPDPQSNKYKYFQLESEVVLQNLSNGYL